MQISDMLYLFCAVRAFYQGVDGFKVIGANQVYTQAFFSPELWSGECSNHFLKSAQPRACLIGRSGRAVMAQND